MNITDIIKNVHDKFPGAIIDQPEGWVVIRKEFLSGVCEFLKGSPASFVSLHCVTAVDRKDVVDVVYHLYSFQHRLMLTLKVSLLNADLSVSSLVPLWESANWLEREVFDLFGVKFIGHPDLRRILNPDDWTDHPLRKDFKRDGFIPKPVK